LKTLTIGESNCGENMSVHNLIVVGFAAALIAAKPAIATEPMESLADFDASAQAALRDLKTPGFTSGR
jgi:hypothetical protein